VSGVSRDRDAWVDHSKVKRVLKDPSLLVVACQVKSSQSVEAEDLTQLNLNHEQV
jgi:hypothetical protein